VIPDSRPVPTRHSADWLDDLLLDSAPPLADDGFSARVVQRIGELAKPGAASTPAVCVPPATALAALFDVRSRGRAWWHAGLTACAAAGAAAVLAPGMPHANSELVGLLQQALLLAAVPLLTGWLLAQASTTD
jgi:hypothetical protein